MAIGHGHAEIGAPRVIDADEGRIGDQVQGEFGIDDRARRPPADVGVEPAPGVAQAFFFRGFVDMARRHEGVAPVDQLLAVTRRARSAGDYARARFPAAGRARAFPDLELLVEPQPRAGRRSTPPPGLACRAWDDLLQHHGAIGQRRAAGLRNRPDGDQGVGVHAFDQRSEIGGLDAPE